MFANVQGVEDELVDGNLFEQPEAFFTQESVVKIDDPDSQPIRLPGIVKMVWIERKSPDEVYADSIEPGVKSDGIEIANKGQYGGGNLYELTKAGQTISYVNLVKTAGLSKGTIIVTWQRDPNQR
ncbi:MAG: hypothetical protein KME17_09305 [Cyanosarcina radialis HA8281-LM2]|jgi:hypothetical protein|nr:hypothetical protein [Cyanosarcina radialis HA8281-LM2]